MGAQGSVFAREANSHWPFTPLKKDTSHPLLIHWADGEGRATGLRALLKVERPVSEGARGGKELLLVSDPVVYE